MKGEPRVLRFLVCAGMELCYLYACVNFVTTSILHQTFPFPEAVGSFFVAALLTLFSEGRGWRVIFVLGVQSLGFVPALVRIVNVFNSWSDSFLSQTWLTDFFVSPSSSVEYSIFILVLAWMLVFWAGGVEYAKRPKDYSTLCFRFDLGLMAFFVLFLTKFYVQTVQGITLDESTSIFLLVPFLIFSLLAIGLVRNESAAQKDFLAGYQTMGVMLGFIVVTLLVGIGLVFFFLPYLTIAAEQGNGILNIVFGPVASAFFWILNWLFGSDYDVIADGPVKKEPTPDVSSQVNFPWWVETMGRILAWCVAIIVALVVLAMLVGLLYSIFRWLFSKTASDQEKPSLRHLFLSFFTDFGALGVAFWRGLVRNVKGYHSAVQLYTALRTWGRTSGVPHFSSETPTEYGLRLERRFPVLAREIDLIVAAFNREVYGEIALSEPQLALAKSAWRGLTNPLHWLMRFSAWFRRPSRLSETIQ